MILSAELPFSLWGEALLTICHVHNRVPSKKIKVSPYELWNSKKPNLDYIKVWGCLVAFYRVVDPKRIKLGSRAMKSVFVGYAKNPKACRLLDLNSNTVVKSRDVFIENKFNIDSMDGLIPTQTQQGDSNPNTTWGTKRIESGSASKQRKSQRIRKVKDFGPYFISYQAQLCLVKGNRQVVLNKIHVVFNTEDDLKTFEKAMASKDFTF